MKLLEILVILSIFLGLIIAGLNTYNNGKKVFNKSKNQLSNAIDLNRKDGHVHGWNCKH